MNADDGHQPHGPDVLRMSDCGRRRPDKYRAIIDAALPVFASDGFTRAGIDTIARKAGVSTRTLYNHFRNKDGLFEAVVQESALRVAEVQSELIDRHLFKVTNLEADLVALGLALQNPAHAHALHAALVRHLAADIEHLPWRVIDTWQQAGPLRVQRALARRFTEFAARGLLVVDDAERAAQHFFVLTAQPGIQWMPVTDAHDSEKHVTSGVRAFLLGHLPRPAEPSAANM